MKVTTAHLRFWNEHQPQPSWAKDIKTEQRPVSVHQLINLQAGERIEAEPYNTLELLRSSRRRKGEVYFHVAKMARFPQCRNPNKRAAYCRKWLARLEAERREQRERAWAECHHSFPNWPHGWCVWCGFNLDEGR